MLAAVQALLIAFGVLLAPSAHAQCASGLTQVGTVFACRPALPIAATNLTNGGNGSSLSTYTTATIAPAANALVVVSVGSIDAANSRTPTVTGAGGTWVQIFSQVEAAAPNRRITMFRDLSATPGSGPLTIDFAGSAQTNCVWAVDQFTNVNISGAHGSGAVVQGVGASANATNTGFSVSLAALGSPNNVAYGGVRNSSATVETAGSGLTELSNQTPVAAFETEWATNKTAVSWTWPSQSVISVAMGVEVAQANSPPGSGGPGGSGGGGGGGGGVPAVAANTFLNSTSAQTHMAQGNPEAPYEAEFTYTGIRHARDGIALPNNSAQDWVNLHNNTISATYPGTTVVIGNEFPPSQQVADGDTLAAAGALWAFEGPNEPNNFGFVYNGTNCGGGGTWLGCAQFQRDLYAAVKADNTAKNYPIYNPSEVGAQNDNVGLQCMVLNSSCPGAAVVTLMAANTAYADYMNAHNYLFAHATSIIDNHAWLNADPESTDGTWDGAWVEWGQTWANNFQGYVHGTGAGGITNVPRVTTETGVQSGTVGLEQQARILMNTYLAQFKRGWSFTSIYLMQDSQGGFSNTYGFFDSSQVAKPSGTYMHNMTTVLADKVNFTAGSLGYTIPEEATQPTVHDLLLEKANGTFYLVVWDERVLNSTNHTVNLNLGSSASGAVYDTTVGVSPVSTFTNQTNVVLLMTDHPLIVRIGP